MMAKIVEYDSKKYNFSELILELFEVQDLSLLHLLDKELCKEERLVQENESETFFHKTFYYKLKNGWPQIEEAYENFVLNEVAPFFDEDFLYQQFPSFRVQVPNQTAVSKWHYDSDKEHGHPDWEINFQIPLTKMNDSSSTWIETVPGLNDFIPINLDCGQFFIFNGNKCRHGNKTNATGKTRVSFDFRVLPISRHDEKTNKKSYYGKRFIEGGYYKRFRKKGE